MSEREARYTAASGLDDPCHPAVKRVMAVADAEQAELRAEVERLRGWIDRSERMQRRAEAAEAKAEDFEGRYEVAHEARMLAEREGDALRAQVDRVEALAEEWEADGPGCAFWGAHTRLRMALSSSEPVTAGGEP